MRMEDVPVWLQDCLCPCQNCANVSQETEERAIWYDSSDDSDRDDADE